MPSSASMLTMGIVMGFQAAALIGAVVTGVLARQRRVETQALNDKLRQINTELRRQREAQDSLLSAVGAAALQEAAPPDGGGGGMQAAAALEALRQQQELLQQERSLLEAALSSPSAAHPTETFGEAGLSIAGARRQIGRCIRSGKELVRDGRPREAFAVLEEGLQLAQETQDLKAERALVRVRARANRECGDPAAALRDLQYSLALSQQLGEAVGDADTWGEMGDLLAELGDLATAGRYYDKCIEAIQNEADSTLSSTWDV